MNSSEQFVKLYPNVNTITYVVHCVETEEKKIKKNSKCVSPYNWEDKTDGYICGLETGCSDIDLSVQISTEDCERKKFVESCTSCKIRKSKDSTDCDCSLPQCVCNQVKPLKTKKYNSLYKRVVHPSYEAFYRKNWWGQKPDSQTKFNGTRHKQFLNLYLKSKPSEFLTATSVCNLPDESDDDSSSECVDSSFDMSRESLDLSGRKSKRQSMKAKKIFIDSASFHDGLSCYKMTISPERPVCPEYPDATTLPGLLLELYCPKTRKCVKEKLMHFIEEHQNNRRGFLDYIYNKHFKKKNLGINLDSQDPCRMKELFKPKKIKTKSLKKKTKIITMQH